MPVVWCRYADGVDIFAAGYLAEVVIRFAVGVAVFLIHEGLCSVAMICVDVTDCQDTDLLFLQKAFEVICAHAAGADQSHRYRFARGGVAKSF